MNYSVFLAAVLSLLLAHIIRVIRWRVILSRAGLETSNTKPLYALSLGYIINSLLPFRFGELVRAGLLCYMLRSRFSTVLATVLVERLADLLAVSLLISSLLKFYPNYLPLLFLYLSCMAAFGLCFYCTWRLNFPRRIVWQIASIFNYGIKNAILNFFSVVTRILFSNSLFLNIWFWVLTVVMWLIYLCSLWFVARAVGIPVEHVFSLVYIENLGSRGLLIFQSKNLWLLIYLSLPVLLVLAYGQLSGLSSSLPIIRFIKIITSVGFYSGSNTRLCSESFYTQDQYSEFLDRLYRGQGGAVLAFEQNGISDVVLYRTFHGGSGAITALIEFEGVLRVRKFATCNLICKLTAQSNWLQLWRPYLPLVEVLNTNSSKDYYYYDMQYAGGSCDLYEGIHVEPIQVSISILNNVIDRVTKFHSHTQMEQASDGVVAEYVYRKVISNIQVISEEFNDIMECKIIELNGEEFNFASFNILKDPEWLSSQLSHRIQSNIHGDLTLENIILSGPRCGEQNWYLIDPNPENIFQSPLIDFSKIMQSLHLGYEALRNKPQASFIRNRLSVNLHRSFQYEKIYSHFNARLHEIYDDKCVKQIYLHEIINYLRLIPYQLQNNREAGLAFFACLCILVREFTQRYKNV